MTVYEFRHTIYIWEDNDTSVTTLIFEKEEDAIEYLNGKKDNIIDEYCIELNIPCSIENLKQYMFLNDECYDEIIDREKYFSVELVSYGRDTLEVTKKDVLKFI